MWGRASTPLPNLVSSIPRVSRPRQRSFAAAAGAGGAPVIKKFNSKSLTVSGRGSGCRGGPGPAVAGLKFISASVEVHLQESCHRRLSRITVTWTCEHDI